jgi:hypothetical protein
VPRAASERCAGAADGGSDDQPGRTLDSAGRWASAHIEASLDTDISPTASGVGLGPDAGRGLLLAAELRAHTNAIGATLSYRIGK